MNGMVVRGLVGVMGVVGVMAGLFAGGCSSSSPPGSSGGSCKDPTPAEASCQSCIQSRCSGPLASATSGPCATVAACESSCACADAACLGSCEANANVACMGELSVLGQCIASSCAGACSPSGPDGGGSSSSSSSSSGSSSSGSVGGAVTVSCMSGTECTQTMVPASDQQMFDQMCGSGAGTGCPTAGLLGCCKIAGATETCYYSAADDGMTVCMTLHGTWSSTP